MNPGVKVINLIDNSSTAPEASKNKHIFEILGTLEKKIDVCLTSF